MRTCLATMVLSLGLITTGFPDDSGVRLHFRANGFSIAPLEGTSETTTYQAVIMFLPETEGFAPNVNVQIQPYNGTINDYATLSRQQFRANGFTIISEDVSDKTIVWECSGTPMGLRMRWYIRAVLYENKVYLATATATASQWQTVSAKLKSCVDSLKIDIGQSGGR